MAILYNILRDKNGQPIFDKNGDFIYTNDIVGELDDDLWGIIKPHLKGSPKSCKMGKPKEPLPLLTHAKRHNEQENQTETTEDNEEIDDEPCFRKKVMFNDAGFPINTQTGYSSDDMYLINNEILSQNDDHENM